MMEGFFWLVMLLADGFLSRARQAAAHPLGFERTSLTS
jgi:hypothetical protein